MRATHNLIQTGSASTLAMVLMAMAACSDSGGRETLSRQSFEVGCAARFTADFSGQSLAHDVEPRPGPAELYAAPPTAPQLENMAPFSAPPILVSGAWAYRCGEFLYQDWLHDDRGAAARRDPTDPFDTTGQLYSPKAGTLTYPTDPVFAHNAADLVEFRIKPLAEQTLFRVTLNTVVDPAYTAFTIALGGDGEGEAVPWPYAANVSSPAEAFLSVIGAQAQFLTASGESRDRVEWRYDAERRQYTLALPHSVWNPGRNTVRMAIGVGLWDAASGSYLQPGPVASATAPGGAYPGGAALFNVGFRSAEPLPSFSDYLGRTMVDAAFFAAVQGHWWRERLQADALADGDISPFYALVDFDKLARQIDDESGVPTSGTLNRIYASRYVFGQGVDWETGCGGISSFRPCEGSMRGQLLPYTVYVPDNAPPEGGYGLTLLLHALTGNYNQYAGSQHERQLGERGSGSIVITPSARGPDGGYHDAAEADVFAVWADVARHYPLNPDRAVTTGYSMGAIGSFRLAARYPDLFARMMSVVGSADANELVSLRHVPVQMWSATLDELVNVRATETTTANLFDLGYRLDAWRFETWDHLTAATFDQYAPAAEFLLDDVVPRNPSRVSYTLQPSEDNADFAVEADKAYWLSDLSLRDPSLGPGTLDATTQGLGTEDGAALAVVTRQGIHDGGNHEPAPYTRRTLRWDDATEFRREDRLSITASNIASVTIHPERAGLSCDADLSLDSDGQMAVKMAGCGGN